MLKVIIDTREQQIGHIVSQFKKMNIQMIRKKLDFGDYSFLINGYSFENEFVIERKYSLNELATNFTKERDRFKREMIRSYEAKATIILFIENASQNDIEEHNYRSRFHPKAFIGSLNSWHKKYNMDVYFCKEVKYSALAILKLFRNYQEKKIKEFELNYEK